MRGEPQDTDRGQWTCRYMRIQGKQTQSEYMDGSETQSYDTNAGAGTEADEAESLWMCKVWRFGAVARAAHVSALQRTVISISILSRFSCSYRNTPQLVLKTRSVALYFCSISC